MKTLADHELIQLPIPHSVRSWPYGGCKTLQSLGYTVVWITGTSQCYTQSVSHCDKWLHLSKPVNMEISNICILHHIFHQHQHQGNPDKGAPTWCQPDQPVGCGLPPPPPPPHTHTHTNAASHSLQGAGSSPISTACVDMLQSLTMDLHKALRSYPSPCHKMGLARERHHKCKQDF